MFFTHAGLDYLSGCAVWVQRTMSVHDAVSHFCRGISEQIDEACIQYLSGIVEDACEGGDTDVADLEDLVQGFLPDFAKLSQQERHDHLWSLLTQVINAEQ